MTYILLLISVIAFVCAADLESRISHSYYFESHGRDDLREWRSVILKGAQYIKIDFNFQTDPSICRQQTRFPSTYNFSKGCFLLVHSFRNTTFWGSTALTFNTTLDIASWLSDDANMDVMMIRPLVFQVCFKGKPNLCDGSDAAVRWTALMDDFYHLVQPIISDPSRIKSNVQFVFDQLNRDDACALTRWRPWNSTWIGESGTGEDNNNGVNATFQMVNMETSWTNDWQHLNQTRMGKFANGRYAMVAWEPVDENDCNNFFQYFRTFGYANEAGTILAYNSDPSMFHVFTANQTERYSHFAFGPEASLTPVTWYDPEARILFTTSLTTTNKDVLVLSMHRRKPCGVFALVASYPIPLKAGVAFDLFGGALSSVAGLSGINGNISEPNTTTLYIAGNNGVIAPISVTFSPLGITIGQMSSVIRLSTGAGAYGLTPVEGRWLIASVATNIQGTLSVQLYNVTGASASPISESFAVAFEVVSDEGLNIATGAIGGSITTVVSWATQRKVFATSGVGTLSDIAKTLVPSFLQVSSDRMVQVGVGRNPYVTFAVSNDGRDELVVLMSFGWSFCYNDMLIDDDAFTMLALKICDLQDYWYTNLFANITNPVNSYVFASYDNFRNELLRYGSSGAQAPHRNGFATTCSDRVFHGVFDVGYNASVVLVPKDEGDVDIVSGGYLGVSSMTSLTWPWVSVSFCGNPIPHSGKAILDSFPLFGFYNQSAL